MILADSDNPFLCELRFRKGASALLSPKSAIVKPLSPIWAKKRSEEAYFILF